MFGCLPECLFAVYVVCFYLGFVRCVCCLLDWFVWVPFGFACFACGNCLFVWI